MVAQPITASRERRRDFFGWRVVSAAFIVAMFGRGVGFYGPSVFVNALHESRGWPVSLISGAITGHFILSAIIVAGLPALHRRFGLMTVTGAGSIAAALGVLGWSAAVEPWQLYAAVPLSGAGWAATSGAAINAIVRSQPARGDIDGVQRVERRRRDLYAALGALDHAFGLHRGFYCDRCSGGRCPLVGCRALFAAHTRGAGLGPGWQCVAGARISCGLFCSRS